MNHFLGPCSDCGCSAGAHYTSCPRLANAVAQMPVPQPTAYDRAQNELSQRIATLDTLRRDWEKESEHRIELLRARLEELWEVSNLTIVDVKKLRSESDDCLRQQLELFKLGPRLDAALRRIEALELEVARLQGPRFLPIDPEHERIVEAAIAGAKARSAVFDANGSPLPDEGT